MRNVIYFTTSLDKNTFHAQLPFFNVVPNLSNQNFHNKLIKAISLNNKVDVISIRPMNIIPYKTLNKESVTEGNVTWHYLKQSKSKIDKFFFLDKRIKSLIKTLKKDDSIIFVDTLNLYLLKEALSCSKKYKIDTIGVITDNPFNISFTSEFYKKSLLANGKKLEKYIVLTEELNKIYNQSHKPYIQIDGITEDRIETPNIINSKYYFFGGSLMKEYGIYNLIDAFKLANLKDTKLLIAGHHKRIDLEEKLNDNIQFIGALTQEQINQVEQHAYACINPRPVNESIDNYSFPSKVIEYMASGSLVISTKSKKLTDNYRDCAIWSNSDSTDDLLRAILKAENLSSNERQEITTRAKKEVTQRTSLIQINNKINKALL